MWISTCTELCPNRYIPKDPDEPFYLFFFAPPLCQLPSRFTTAYNHDMMIYPKNLPQAFSRTGNSSLSRTFVFQGPQFTFETSHSTARLTLEFQRVWGLDHINSTQKMKKKVSIQSLGRNLHRNSGSVSMLHYSSLFANAVGSKVSLGATRIRAPSHPRWHFPPAGGQVWNLSLFTWFISSPWRVRTLGWQLFNKTDLITSSICTATAGEEWSMWLLHICTALKILKGRFTKKKIPLEMLLNYFNAIF